MGRLVVAVAAALLVIGVVVLWRIQRTMPTEAPRRGDPLVVVSAPPPSIATSPAPVAPSGTSDDPHDGVDGSQRASILAALRLPPEARLLSITTNDPKGTVCGTVTAANASLGRGFIYVGQAGLAAIDDGGADFARLRGRLCKQ